MPSMEECDTSLREITMNIQRNKFLLKKDQKRRIAVDNRTENCRKLRQQQLRVRRISHSWDLSSRFSFLEDLNLASRGDKCLLYVTKIKMWSWILS
jgi:hypothetical protein